MQKGTCYNTGRISSCILDNPHYPAQSCGISSDFSRLGLRPRRLSIRRYSARFCRIIVKYKPHATHNSSIRSNEGLALETSAFESLYGGQITLSTQLIKPNYLVNWKTLANCFDTAIFARSFSNACKKTVLQRKDLHILCYHDLPLCLLCNTPK